MMIYSDPDLKNPLIFNTHDPRASIEFAFNYFEGKTHHIAEIGVCYGANAYRLKTNLNPDLMYLIDLTGPDKLDKNYWNGESIDALQKYTWLQGNSPEMAVHIPDGSLDMVYIDGDHTVAGCYKDIVAYYPKVRKGGIIAGHDWITTDPTECVAMACDTFFGPGTYSVKEGSTDWWMVKND
jgi:predicted O-methyltransferase YrrM